MLAERWMDRTRGQKEANDFDCDLYRLIVRAERLALESVPVDRAKWNDTLAHLRRARSGARQLMHKDDIEQTA